MSLGDNFTTALDASNNTLSQTPGLAVDAATSGDPANAGLLLSHAAATQAVTQAAQQDATSQNDNKNSGGGLMHWLGRVASGAGRGIAQGAAMIPGGQAVVAALGIGAKTATQGTKALNKPLSDVQSDYRYVHEVYARQGVMPGMLATLAIGGGAAAGGYATGSVQGAVLGGEAVAEGERGLARAGVFGDQYKQDALLADNRGTQISPGRDWANALSHFPGLSSLSNTNKGWGKVISGGTDAAFDLSTDPVLKAGTVYKDLKYGSDLAIAKSSMIRQFLDARGYAPGLAATDPETVQKLYHSRYWGGGYRRALDMLAGMNGGDIVARFPELRGLIPDRQVGSAIIGSSTIQGLGSASTRDEVHQVFLNAARNSEFAKRMFQATLPSRDIAHAKAGDVADWLKNLDPEGTPATQRGVLIPSKVGAGATDWQAPAAVTAPLKALSGDLSGAKQDIAGAMSRKMRTFTGFLPTAIDPDTAKLSRNTFDPMDPEALLGVYRSFKFMGEARARELTDQFAAAQTIGQKKKIWNEGMLEVLKAHGLPDDPDLLREVSGQVRAIGSNVGSSLYGHGLASGDAVSKAPFDGGTLDDAALWTDQRGKFAFPDFSKVKSATRELHGLSSVAYNNMDELANIYTKKIFKPLALVNMGFGLRVATSELIPSLLRNGPMNLVTGKINASAAKVNYKLDTDRLTGQADNLMNRAQIARSAGSETNAANYEAQANALYEKAGERVEHYHVLKAASTLLGGASKFLGSTDEDRDLAYRIVMANEGHFVKGISDTAHGNTSYYYADDPNVRAQQQVEVGRQWLGRQRLAPSGDYGLFSHDAADFTSRWHLELQKRSQNTASQNIAGDLLDAHNRGMSTDEAFAHAQKLEAQRIKTDPTYDFDRKVLARHETQTPAELAADRVDAMQGLLVGRDGTVHSDLMQKVANGEKPSLSEIEGIDPATRPDGTIGEIYRPPMSHTGALENLVSMGFRRLVDPIINGLSREPTYYAAVRKEWRNLSWLRENGLNEDDALRLAQYRGTMAMLPQIHNTELRTQFHALASNYFPFLFAQQQALQRAAILIAQNPNAIRGLQLTTHGLNDPGFVHSDGSGNRYLMVPMLGEFGKFIQPGMQGLFGPMVTGLPMSVSGSMESLKTVLPEMQMPGVAPLVSVPLNAISSLSDEMHAPWANSFASLTKQVLGDRGYGAAFFDSVMPNAFIRNSIMAASPDEQSRSFSNAMLSAIASAYYHGQVPAANASVSEQQAFLDRIRNNARSVFMIKAALGLVSPLSPQVAQEDPGFSDEFYSLVKKQGYAAAIQQFMKEHGDKSISYTVAHSDAAVPGASIPYTQKAMDWIQANNSLVSGPYQTGAAFLVPQDPAGGDVQKISNQLLQMHLRARRTPQDFLNAIYIAAGNSAYFADEKRYKDALAATSAEPTMNQALQVAWRAHTASMAQWNPVWYDDFASPIRANNAIRAYSDLYQIFSQGLAPAGPQSDAVRSLMESYANYQLQDAALGTSRTSGANAARKSLEQGWTDFLDKQMQSNPELAPVIRAVFSKLPNTQAAMQALDAGAASLASA